MGSLVLRWTPETAAQAQQQQQQQTVVVGRSGSARDGSIAEVFFSMIEHIPGVC